MTDERSSDEMETQLVLDFMKTGKSVEYTKELIRKQQEVSLKQSNVAAEQPTVRRVEVVRAQPVVAQTRPRTTLDEAGLTKLGTAELIRILKDDFNFTAIDTLSYKGKRIAPLVAKIMELREE